MIDFLNSVEFGVFKSCGCNGGEAQFKHRTAGKMLGVIVKVMRRSQSYEIKRDGVVINRGMSHQLETEYNKLFA